MTETVPDFQSFFYPILNFAADKEEHSLNEIREFLTDHFNLSDEAKSERVPSGSQTKFDNRIYWTKSYFSKAKLIENTKRSHFRITDRGLKFLNQYNSDFTISDLKTIDEFKEFSEGTSTENEKKSNKGIQEEQNDLIKTPVEKLEESYQYIKQELASELLEKIRLNSWQFFEDLVIDLMIKMGYGGSKSQAGKSIKRTNDEGIDGIINEDKLGLDLIYLQAKMWKAETTIGRPEIQKFVGALAVAQSNKGVFITTSYFSKGAIEYVESLFGNTTIVLIDGKDLASYIYDYGLGMQIEQTIEIKKMDTDFWDSMANQ